MEENQRTDLTDSQWNALNKAWEMLKEHFDHVIIAYDTEAREGTDRITEVNYHGGTTSAIGLAEKAKYKLLTMPVEESGSGFQSQE